VPGRYHAFLGVDPVVGRGPRELLREVFCVPPDAVGLPKQVHSATVLPFERGGEGARGPGREGDALWTATPGSGVGVRTADCVPILLAHEERPVAAAIHAGWRGLAAGIVAETVRTLAVSGGEELLGGMLAAAGPCARGCCYEVEEEAAEALRSVPGGGGLLRRGKARGKWMADLQAIALSALVAAGIPPARAEGVGPCTVCSPRFHSFRREKALTAHQVSFIYIIDFLQGT
jgi:YfiH family protein